MTLTPTVFHDTTSFYSGGNAVNATDVYMVAFDGTPTFRVEKVNRSTHAETTFYTAAAGVFLRKMDITATDLFVCEIDTGTSAEALRSIDLGGSTNWATVIPDGALDVKVRPADGAPWVLCSDGSTIQELDATGTLVDTYVAPVGLDSLTAIAWGADGRLFMVNDDNTSMMAVFDPVDDSFTVLLTGPLPDAIHPDDLIDFEGITVRDGRVYLVDPTSTSVDPDYGWLLISTDLTGGDIRVEYMALQPGPWDSADPQTLFVDGTGRIWSSSNVGTTSHPNHFVMYFGDRLPMRVGMLRMNPT